MDTSLKISIDSLDLKMLIDYLEESNLPEPYHTMERLIGIENTLSLAQEYQGTNVYFAKLDKLIRQIRDKKICEEYNADNLKQLAQKYNLSETWVREILSGTQKR